MARSLKKGLFVAEGVIRALKRNEADNKKPIKIWSRASVITPGFIGKNITVYNGMKWIPVLISEGHVGHKFGEFSPTRVIAKHAGKKIKRGKK